MKRIQISEPDVGRDAEELVLQVLRSGRLAQGPMVEALEALCAEMAGTSDAVAVANGTVSLEATLEVLGIGPGDEVITSPLTFVATLNAVLRSGATARFADVTDDFTIDPKSVTALINDRTAALLPVHLYGHPADMPALQLLAQRHGLALVEDAAQAHGAAVGGKRVGGFGVGSFSFYATKNVAVGEGGVITTSDADLVRRLRLLRNQGMSRPYQYELVGRNLRMSELHAAVAIPQLNRLEAQRLRRERGAEHLTRSLSHIESLVTPRARSGCHHAWHQYTVLLPPGTRGRVIDQMALHHVETGVYYPALVWDHEVFRSNKQVIPDRTPRAADIVERCLSVPVHPRLTDADLDRVAHELRDAVDASSS